MGLSYRQESASYGELLLPGSLLSTLVGVLSVLLPMRHREGPKRAKGAKGATWCHGDWDMNDMSIWMLWTLSAWWFGTFFIFPYIGNGIIIPTDFPSIIFQRGRWLNHQPVIYIISWENSHRTKWWQAR